MRLKRPYIFRCNGRSMLPILCEDSVVVVDPLKSKIKVGDIICVKLGGKYVIHRVFEFFPQTSSVFLKGDNEDKLELSSTDEIIGKVNLVICHSNKFSTESLFVRGWGRILCTLNSLSNRYPFMSRLYNPSNRSRGHKLVHFFSRI